MLSFISLEKEFKKNRKSVEICLSCWLDGVPFTSGFLPFSITRYVGTISEAAPVNTVVLGDDGNPLVIQATDTDRNHNALFVFHILDETARKFFSIDSVTGSIR